MALSVFQERRTTDDNDTDNNEHAAIHAPSVPTVRNPADSCELDARRVSGATSPAIVNCLRGGPRLLFLTRHAHVASSTSL